MTEVMKSIFRQREIEKLYELKAVSRYDYCMSRYSNRVIAVGNDEKVISDKEIGRYDIEIPMLEVGDEFFLHDIKEVVVIKSVMRSSDGYIIYYVEDKIIETKNTKKSYEECNNRIDHWGYEKEKFEELEKEFEEYKKKYKYENRFLNKKHKD